MNQREEIIQRVYESLDYLPASSSSGRRKIADLVFSGARADRQGDTRAAYRRYYDALTELRRLNNSHARKGIEPLEKRLHSMRNASVSEIAQEALFNAE